MNQTSSISSITMKLFDFEVCPVNLLNRQFTLPVLFVGSELISAFIAQNFIEIKV